MSSPSSIQYQKQKVLLFLHTLLLIISSLLQVQVASSLSTPKPQTSRRPPPTPRKRSTSSSSSRNKAWHAKRQSGIKVKSTSKKAPRWEKEGDALYHAVGGGGSINSENEEDGRREKITSVKEAREAMNKLISSVTTKEENETKPKQKAQDTSATEESNKEQKSTSPFLWGNLPVGPILRTSLLHSSFSTPTPIQSAAFAAITSGKNVILASPTGSGKSLAFLVPLLATTPRKVKGGTKKKKMVLMITPTSELARQLQRNVDLLWSPGEKEESGVHVVIDDTSKEEHEEENKSALVTQYNPAAPINAGTPRSIRSLLSQAQYMLKHKIIYNAEEVQKAQELLNSLQNNLATVVMDEADRLLNTEQVVRDTIEKKEFRQQQQQVNNEKNPKKKKKSPNKASKTQTELLLRDLSIPPPPYSKQKTPQIICASATVGRTLRRQLMTLLQSPSMDKTATLITSDDRRSKDKKHKVEERKGSLLPDSLTHCYSFVSYDHSISTKDSEESTTASVVKKNKKKRGQEESKLLLCQTVQQINDIMTHCLKNEPGSILIFPGKFGVEHVCNEFLFNNDQEMKLNISTLKDVATTLGQQLDNNNAEDKKSSWEHENVYIIPDKFARGLDIPLIRYVFILSAQSSAAKYTHLAGRTGRNGQKGVAISMVQPRDVYKYGSIVDSLGLLGGNGVRELIVPQSEEKKEEEEGIIMSESIVDVDESTESSSSRQQQHPWKTLSEATLKRKTIAELTEYIHCQGMALPSDTGKRILKQDLIALIQEN